MLWCHLTGIHGASSTELARPVHVSAVEVVADPGGHRGNLNNLSQNQLNLFCRLQTAPLEVRDEFHLSNIGIWDLKWSSVAGWVFSP